MNILIVPTNDWVRAPGHGHIDYIAESLAKKGHNVYAWNFDLYKNQPAKRNPERVVLVKSPTVPFRDAALFFAFNAVFQFPAMVKAVKKLKIDVVVNENIFSGLMAFWACGAALKVFDYSDYFPESASVYYEGAPFLGKLVEAATLAITKLNIKTADLCLAVCQSLINNIHSIDKQKPCFFLTNSVDLAKHQTTPKTDPNPYSPTIVVMGVIDSWLDLATPLKAIKNLSTQYPDVKMLIVGPWRNQAFKASTENVIKEQQLEAHVTVTGYVSDQQLAQILDRATCCVIPYRTDFYSATIRLPEKLFVYSAHSKPILCSPLPEVKALGLKHVRFYRSAEELTEEAAAILADSNLREEMSREALKFAREHDVEVLAGKLEEILLANLR